MKRYITRHKKDPTDIHTPGELSRVVLWSSKTLKGGIKNLEKKHPSYDVVIKR